MRIGIDAHSWSGNLAGNETYTTNLIKNLARIDKDNHYRIYITKKEILYNELFGQPNLQARLIRPSNRWIRVPFSTPIALSKDKVDLLHMQYFAPLICPCKFVLTILDISFDLFPGWFTRRELFMFKFVKSAIKRARCLITISRFTKEKILERYDIAQNKVKVVYCGVNEIFKPLKDLALTRRIKEKYKIPDDFILYVGRFNIRKNISGLLYAFKILKETRAVADKLVLVGEKSWKYEDVNKLVCKLNLEREVVFPGYISEEDLPPIYCSAKVFVFPSFYESFPFPPLEAMACGTPVITSNTSGFPELITDAGIMVDPYDIEGLAKAIWEVLKDEGLREELSLKGLERARGFSWLETAKKTLEVYKEVYKER